MRNVSDSNFSYREFIGSKFGWNQRCEMDLTKAGFWVGRCSMLRQHKWQTWPGCLATCHRLQLPLGTEDGDANSGPTAARGWVVSLLFRVCINSWLILGPTKISVVIFIATLSTGGGGSMFWKLIWRRQTGPMSAASSRSPAALKTPG